MHVRDRNPLEHQRDARLVAGVLLGNIAEARLSRQLRVELEIDLMRRAEDRLDDSDQLANRDLFPEHLKQFTLQRDARRFKVVRAAAR